MGIKLTRDCKITETASSTSQSLIVMLRTILNMNVDLILHITYVSQ